MVGFIFIILFLWLLIGILKWWMLRTLKKELANGGAPDSPTYWRIIRRLVARLMLLVLGVSILCALGGESAQESGALFGIGLVSSLMVVLLVTGIAMLLLWMAFRSAQPPAPPVPTTTRGRTVEIARTFDERFAPPPPPPPLPTPPPPGPPQPSKFFLHIGSEVKGPFTMEQIRGIISVGTASLNTQCCKEGTQEWRPVSAFV